MATTLWLINVVMPILYPRGYLTRVQTIHFARWVLLDDDRRVCFASNYDGSLESYMDDFINKVRVGHQRRVRQRASVSRACYWLFGGGARFEGKYKRYLRRHQIPTAVWYKAYPGLSVADLNRNSMIRQGGSTSRLDEAATMAWLSLL